MHKTIVHTIRDNSRHTKEDVEIFGKLMDEGYEVMTYFNYRNEYYYVMMKHMHDMEDEEVQSN